jgi:hypothetical protein
MDSALHKIRIMGVPWQSDTQEAAGEFTAVALLEALPAHSHMPQLLHGVALHAHMV